MANVPYANTIGCLMYAMVLTRPNIARAISVVSRYMAQPRREYWKAFKWISRNLNGSMSYGLVYKRSKCDSDGLQGYIDSNYTGDLDKRRSLTGYVFNNWRATLQYVMALSTTKAEFTTAIEAAKAALWPKELVTKLRMN